MKLAPDQSASLETLAARVERALREAHATDVSRTGTLVVARIGFFDLRLFGFDALSFVDGGEVRVVGGAPVTLDYRFTCRQSLLFSLAAFDIGAVAMVLVPRTPPGLAVALVGFWAALILARFTIGYSITAFRLPSVFDEVGS